MVYIKNKYKLVWFQFGNACKFMFHLKLFICIEFVILPLPKTGAKYFVVIPLTSITAKINIFAKICILTLHNPVKMIIL